MAVRHGGGGPGLGYNAVPPPSFLDCPIYGMERSHGRTAAPLDRPPWAALWAVSWITGNAG